jgi:transposase
MPYSRYFGLDLHKQFTQIIAVDTRGRVVAQGRLHTTPEALRQFAQTLSPRDAICVEATTNAVAVHQLLAQHAGLAVISNPLQTKAIASAKIKTDKVDALVLAQLLRTDYLPTVWVPPAPTMQLRAQTSYRSALVRQRTQVKNRIHSLLHRQLIPLPEISDLFGQAGRTFLEQVPLPTAERLQLQQELALLDVLAAQIQAAEVQIAKSVAATAELRLLLSLPGFQLACAVGLLAAIGDITRFAAPDKLVSYVGLDPLARSSADHPFGSTRISKRGRSHARWLLIEAATAAVRVPGPLKAFYLRLKAKKGHNKAIVATARKLAVIAWHMLTTGEPYRWAPPIQTREKIRRVEILAGAPKQRSGKTKGVPSKGGRQTYRELRRAGHDMAKLAQAQYEQLVAQRHATAAATTALGAGSASVRGSTRPELSAAAVRHQTANGTEKD